MIAQTGYHARRSGLFIAALRAGGQPDPSLDGAAQDIALGATLPPRALRHLIDHASVHLNVEWRDLEDAQWALAHRGTAVRDTPMIRARLLWQNALLLGAGGREKDVPDALT